MADQGHYHRAARLDDSTSPVPRRGNADAASQRDGPRTQPRLALGTETFELHEGELLVGSGAQANWRVTGRDLVSRHFIVRLQSGCAALYPASSAAVVTVDGDQVLEDGRELADGDLIAAGSACFLFWTGAPRSTAPDWAPAPPAHLVTDEWAIACPLTRTSTPIGRDPTNVIVVRDATASRFHAEVRREAGGYALHGMGSSGTRINGEELRAPRLLHEGDLIELAFVSLRFTGEPIPANVAVSTEPIAIGDAAHEERTGQSRRVSLQDVGAETEPPRNLWLLVGSALVIVVLVAAAFWLLR